MKKLFNLSLLLLTLMLVLFNPAGFESRVALSLYCLPVISLFWIHFSEVYSTKSLKDSEKRLILYEQIQSIVRKALAVVSILVLSGLSKSIPYFDALNNALKYFSENFGSASKGLEVFIGFVMLLISHFYKFDRFESRIINPRKINI